MGKLIIFFPLFAFSTLSFADEIAIDANTKSLTASEIESCHKFVANKYSTIVDHYKLHVAKNFDTILDQKVASSLQKSCLMGMFYTKNHVMAGLINKIPYDEYQNFYSTQPILYGEDATNLISALHDAAVYGSNLLGGPPDDGSRITINGVVHKGGGEDTADYLKDTQKGVTKSKKAQHSKNEVLKSCLNISFLTVINFNKQNNTNYDLAKTAGENNYYCTNAYDYSRKGVPIKKIESIYLNNFNKAKSKNPSKTKEMTDSINIAIALTRMGYKISEDDTLFESSLSEFNKANNN